ncbi:MAG: hypothetical protein ACYTDT_06080 [Planctomycetota bacterium]
MLRKFISLTFMLALLSPSVFAQAESKVDSKTLFEDPCLLKLDYDGHLQNLCRLIKQDPSSIDALAALHRAMELRKQVNTDRPLYDLLQPIADEDFKACGAHAADYVEVYSTLAAEFDATHSWQPVIKRWLGVREWMFVGPFAEQVASVHADVFPPESRFDVNASYDGAFEQVKWQEVRYVDPLEDEVDFNVQKRWSGYGYYLATNFVSASDREAVLLISATGPGKVWWRGQPLIDMDVRGRDLPVMSLPVKLSRGANLLMIKVSGMGDWSVKFHDGAGRPINDFVPSKPTNVKAQVVTGGDFPDHLAIPAALASQDGIDELLQSTIYRKHDMDYAAFELLEDVFEIEIAAAKPNVFRLLEVLRLTDDSPLLSGPAKRRRSNTIVKLLANSDNAGDAADYFKGKLLASNDQVQVATEVFRKLAKSVPGAFLPWLELAKLYETVEWRAEWKHALNMADKLAPQALAVALQWEDFFSARRDTGGEIAIDRRYLETRPSSRDALLSLALNLQRVGKPDEGLKYARLAVKSDPGNEFAMNRLAQSLVLTGNLDEALEVYESLAAMTAEPEGVLQEAASQCLKLGKDEQAEKLLKRVIEIAPGSHTARRQLGLLTGQDYDFWKRDATNWEQVKDYEVKAEDFPRANSALVIDELIQWVFADGSSISYTRQVRKILTQDGVDGRGKERIRGELVLARTIKADGTELEPITQAGGLVEFPGVEVGCYIDIAYLLHTPPNPHGRLLGDVFYFMDQGMDEPFGVSRWVIYNQGKPLQFIQHNTDDSLKHSISRSASYERHEFSRAKPEHPDFEPYMPSPLEFIPWIEVIDERDWHSRVREAADYGLSRCRTTKQLRTKAHELTKGAKDDTAKAKAIYQWVNANFRSRGSAWNAHQALGDMAGDRERLFIALCAGAEINLGFAYVDRAQPYKLPDLERPARPSWMYRSDNDYTDFFITVRNADGQRSWISMEQRLAPFGVVSSRMADASALVFEDSRYRLVRIPGQDSQKDRFENHINIELNADGSADVDGKLVFHGDRSYSAKESLTNRTEEDRNRELIGDLSAQIPGFSATELGHPDLATVGTPLTRTFKGNTKQMAKATGDTLTLSLPMEKYGRLLSILVAGEKREYDLDLAFNMHQLDELRITPPAGYSFSEVPKSLLYPTTPLEYALEVELDGRELVIKRSLTLGPGRFYPSQYPDLQRQINRIRKAEDVLLVMKKD